jgi:hypothetical protein
MSKKFYIYLITNRISKKQYIGSRINYTGEATKDNYWGSSKYLNIDYKNLGKENFTKEILFEGKYINKENLLEKETEYILQYNTLNPFGYNKQKPNIYPGFYIVGSHLSNLSKKKISEGLKKAYKEGRKKKPDYSGKSHPMFGKHQSREAKEKISKVQIGKKLSAQTKNYISLSLKNKLKSDIHRKNISKGRIGIIFSNTHKKNLSRSHKGIINSFSEEGKSILSRTASKINSRRIKCEICNLYFNPGNYGRHMKCKHGKV